jgi:two-component system, chemotaxis family, chemotaxis protein CheY
MFSSLKASLADRNESVPRVQLGCSAEGDRKDLGASSFVLIVNDDPDLLDATSFVLEAEGMAVETARNGEEALALIGAGRRPALVLLDLVMPVMNGWEFLATVANDPRLKGIPVVVLTAGKHSEVPGALEILSEPMDLKELLRIVERHVRGNKATGA